MQARSCIVMCDAVCRRAAEEEDLFLRVPLSKDERKRLKSTRRADLAGGIMLDDFADDVSHLVQVEVLPPNFFVFFYFSW